MPPKYNNEISYKHEKNLINIHKNQIKINNASIKLLPICVEAAKDVEVPHRHQYVHLDWLSREAARA